MENWQIIQSRWRGEIPVAGSDFDKSPTPAILAFEVCVVVAFVVAAVGLPKLARRMPQRFLVMACGVLIFELFTGPMWRNLKMGTWAYLFQGVSWILTLGWSTLILGTVLLVDHFLPRWRELPRFVLSLAILTPCVIGFEVWLHAIGLRRYAPEVMETVSGRTLLGLPLEILYYVPVFLALIVSFYKYWSFVIDGVPVIPVARTPWLRTLLVSVAGVLMFEIMVEPMVRNGGFPAWSYVYKDITILMTGFWVLVLWLSVNLVDRLLIHWDLKHRFLAYLGVTALIAVPAEAWLIASGHRIYGPSSVANFSRLTLPWTGVPIEVVFAIPLYFALVIGFIRFVEIALTNRDTLHVR
jgi:hypothetical protein